MFIVKWLRVFRKSLDVNPFLWYSSRLYLRGFMLKILRKYQKGIFAVVAFMVIASFSFFGTYGAINSGRPEEEDKIIGKAIDGSSLSSREITHLTRFLDTDFKDVMSGGPANLLNDGFIRNDLLRSGLGPLLFEAYKDEVDGELYGKIAKFKEFKTYAHPNHLISFEEVLRHFSPGYYDDLNKFRGENGGAQELIKLYLNQGDVPPEMIRRMMLYMEYQYANMAPQDPYLKSVDLSLFYAKSVTDWFGKNFLEKVAHLVCQGAAFAKQHGYKVSFEEAKSSLMQIGLKHLKELDQNKTITSDELNRFYKQQVSLLQMDDKDVVKIWQKILVFRKMLDEIGCSVFVDSLLYKQFSEFASKGAKVEVYKLPAAIRLKSAEDLMKLETYLDLVSPVKEGAALPEEFLSVDEVKKRAPELVEKRFLVNVASCKKEILAREIGVRKTWDWQLDSSNWAVLKERFPEISKCKSTDSEGRFTYLEGLDPAVREKVDQFSRKKILEMEPDFIKERLAKIEAQRRLISIPFAGKKEIFPGVFDRAAILESRPVYTENGEDFYRIQVVDQSPVWEILTFEEANKLGVLDVSRKASHEFTVAHRLLPFMQKMEKAVIAGEEGVLQEAVHSSRETLEPKLPLSKQWKLQKEELKITRKMKNHLLGEKLFAMQEGSWSDVICTDEGPIFYQVIETFVDTSEVGKKMEEGRALLGKEAKEHFMKELLKEIRGS